MGIYNFHTSAGEVLGDIDFVAADEVLVIMPVIDMALGQAAAQRMAYYAGAPCKIAIVDDKARLGFVRSVNLLSSKLGARRAVYTAQDGLVGKDWLRFALDRMVARKAAVVVFNEGVRCGTLPQFGLVDLAFWAKHYGPGNIFFPGYKRHRADDELGQIASRAGVYAYEAKALMMEVDFRVEARKIDAEDTKLYVARKRANFPPVK